jgi:NAD-specific glutamate dehydrogenase
VFEAYQAVGEALSLDRLRTNAHQALSDMPFWDRLATRRLLRELEGQQAEATSLALSKGGVDGWMKANTSARTTLVSDIKLYTASNPNFAQFALAADSVRQFMQTVNV